MGTAMPGLSKKTIPTMILEPRRLADQVKEEAERTIKAYGELRELG